MQGNVNIPDSTITSELTFRQLVLMNMQQLTNFPYIEKDFDALTDYELLSLVVKFLNDVIANQNEQNNSITNLYNAFLALQDYVNNTKNTLEDAFNTLDNYVRYYFDNLDVQEEINNKLDDMLEQGTLQEIIYQFIQSNVAWAFNTVADMKLATNFIDGSFAQTLGYHSISDGGSALYKIRTITNDDVIDEQFLIALSDDTLVAELVIINELNVNACGIYGDNEHDDYTNLNTLLGKAKTKKLKVVFNSSSTYLISAPLNVANLDIDFNYATFKVYGNETIDNVINVNNTNYYTTLRNLNIDATHATVGLDLIQARKCYIENVNITNISNIGIRQTGGYETKITHCNLTGDGTSHCYGIYAYGHDNTYNDFVMIDCYTAIYNRGLNFYNDIHAWLSNADLFYHSCFMDVERGQLLCTNMYCDTYHWCIASESDISEIVVNNLYLIAHEDYATSESSHGEPVALHYSKADGYNARMINIKNSIILAPPTIGIVWNTDSTGNQINYCGVLEARFPSVATYYLQGIPNSPTINIPASLTKTNEFTNIHMDSVDINWFYKVAEAKNSYSFTLPFFVNECRLPVFKSLQWDGETPIGMAYFNNNSCTIAITGGSSEISTSYYLHIVGVLPRIYRANS